jgi:colicin import membrane protein
MKPAVAGVPYRVPPEPSRWPSIALAAAMHLGLLAFLFIGISWQNNAPVAVEAEVWEMKTQAAAPPPPPPPEVVEPAPEPVPKVVEPPPVEQPAAPPPPDIALEKRKEEKRKQLEEKKLEEQQLEKELKAKQLAEQKKAVELAEKKLADKLKAEKLAKARQAADEQKRLDKQRDEEMKRITGGAGATGEAAKSTAPRIDTGYLASITSKIKSTTSYAGNTDVSGNPTVVFKVEQLPTGEVISVRLVRSSGVSTFDDAVEKGINKASPLPKKKNGTVERTLEIVFKMKDLND